MDAFFFYSEMEMKCDKLVKKLATKTNEQQLRFKQK